jgi:cation:H+ antiporter
MIMEYALLVLGLVILLAGGKYLVDGASAVALDLGWSPGLIGLTVVAFGTSAPELLVSINAALKGTSDIALGNVIGSNIANLTLILGISAVMLPIILHKSVLKMDYLSALGSSILFFFMAYNGLISRFEGIILIILLVGLNYYFFLKLRTVAEEGQSQQEDIKRIPVWKGIVLVILGIFGLYLGSELMVSNAITISQALGVSERIIGVTVIAIGTSLPELATSIIAAINKKTDIALGNILGSNIMNVLAIIGITSLISPISVAPIFLEQDFIWMMGITLLLFPILKTRLTVSRWEGGLLLAMYGFYLFSIL